MMRGGHLDVCVLGADQVAFNGDLADWRLQARRHPRRRRHQDLAVGAKDVYVMMTLFTRSGALRNSRSDSASRCRSERFVPRTPG